MPPTNEFLTFCPTDTGTNLLTESEYAASADRTSGNKPGVASAKLNNRALRQANAVASQLAQMAANQLGSDVLDDGVSARLLSQFLATLKPYAPNTTTLTSGAGTFAVTHIFFIASGSATIGATYTNNAQTFTVVATVSGATEVRMTGTGAPATNGTLTKTSGTGDTTLTFYAFRKSLYLRICMVGGGGGGSGSGDASGTVPTAGTDGGNSTFGTTLLVANGGGGGNIYGFGNGGAGGTASLGSGPIGVAMSGGSGGGAGVQQVQTTSEPNGGSGGASPFGGAGGGGTATQAGLAAATNSGSGGGGGGGGNGGATCGSGSGGGAGGYVDAIITSPTSTYSYTVGAAGTAGTAGGNGSAGGAGGAGIIIVEEHFQ